MTAFRKAAAIGPVLTIKKGIRRTVLYRLATILYEAVWKTIEDRYQANINKPAFADGKTMNTLATKLLQNQSKEPFFLWIHYMDAHCPYSPPRSSLTIDITRQEQERLNQLVIKHNYVETLSPEDFRKIKELYERSVSYADFRIGELIMNLHRLELLKNTVVIVSADHGEELLDHGGLQHSVQLYDEVMRVPLIIYGIEKKGEVRGQRGLINLAPTILDLLGLPEEPNFKGKSMFQEADDEVVMITGTGRLGIRTEGWKYISPNELYDLQKDPKEKSNVAQENDGVVREFETRLNRYGWKENFKTKKSMQYELSEEETKIIESRLKELGYMD